MPGWIAASFVLLLAAVIAWRLSAALRAEKGRMAEFVRSDAERAERRRRVFGILHKLGDAILGDQSDVTLHRIITEGAASVAGAPGAALYLFDEKSQVLVPRHHTPGCPPLIGLPERIAEQARTNKATLPSFLKLHSIAPDEGVLGEVFTSQHEENVPDLRRHPKFNGAANSFQQHVSAVVAPLRYGGRKIGVMAAADGGGAPFAQHTLEMFVALAEQCGFALGSARAHQEAGAKRAIEAELRSASEIQRVLLPAKAPETEGLDIAGSSVPARLVSGDYFDYFPLGAGHVGIVIADVCGKGIPASLITAMCRSVLRAQAREDLSPATVLAAVNRNLFPDIREDMFITATYASATRDGSEVTLARAGHTTPLVWRSGTGMVEEIAAPGLVIGMDKGEVFERATRDVSVKMDHGDVLLLYTDGVNEAADHKELLFGEDRIKKILALAAPQGAQSVVTSLSAAVDEFLGAEPQNDDITIVAVRRK